MVIARIFCAMLTLLLLGCSNKDKDPQYVIEEASRELSIPNNLNQAVIVQESDSLLFGRIALRDEDARTLRGAEAILNVLRTDPVPPADPSPNWIKDDLTKALFELARRKATPNEPAIDLTSIAGVDPTSLSENERTAIIHSIQAQVEDIVKQYAVALADDAILPHLKATAKLTVIHQDLFSSVADPKALPNDPLALASDEYLKQALEGLKPTKYRLESHLAYFDTPEARVQLDFARKEMNRIELIRISAAYKAFQVGSSKIFNSISKDKWAAAVSTQETRTEVAFKKLQAMAIAQNPTLQSAFSAVQAIRGPPALDALILTDVIETNTNVRGWCHAEAKLIALSEAINRLTSKQLPAIAHLQNANWRDLVLTLAEDATLQQLKRYLRSEELNKLTTLSINPVSYTRLHHEWWKLAIEKELKRRNVGGVYVDKISNNGVIKQLVQEHATPGFIASNSKAEMRLLAVIHLRFPEKWLLPKSLHTDVGNILPKVITNYELALSALIKETQLYEDYLAASTYIVDADIRTDYDKMRKHIYDMSIALEQYAMEMEKQGFKTYNSNLRKKIALAVILYGPNPPPPDDKNFGGTAPSPIDPDGVQKRGSKPPTVGPQGGADSKSLPLAKVPQIEKAMHEANLQAQELQAKIQDRIRGIETEHIIFAQNHGRQSISKKAWGLENVRLALQTDRQKTRLPEAYKYWEGRLDPKTSKPYDYQVEVQNFKDFPPVGGGIHFGDVATADSNYSEYVLRYDIQTKHLYLLGQNGRQLSLGTVEPDVLKNLYRFAKSGRNAAISIGWGVDRQSAIERLDPSKETGSVVLLDPYFVDTRVGQDLIRADKVPWDLERQFLPNGKPNPVAGPFGISVKKFREEEKAQFNAIFEGVVPYDNSQRDLWIRSLENHQSGWSFVIAYLLKFDETKAAINELRFRAALSDEPVNTVNAVAVIAQSAIIESINEGNCDTYLLQLWGAMLRAKDKKLTNEDLAVLVKYILGAPTLAVLMDDPIQINTVKNMIHLKGAMRYTYASSWVSIDETSVRLGRNDGTNVQKVKRLNELMRIANDHFDQLQRLYMPLQRIAEYARLTAFLRWARMPGSLAGINLNSLAQIPANDSKTFPTADFIRYEK